MKLKSLKYIGIAIILIASSLMFISSRSNTDELRRELLIKVISFAIDNGHYHPGNINDEFSKKAFDLYIDRLDFSKRFFLKEDIESMKKYRNELDDAMLNVDFEFLDFSIELMNKRVAESEDYYKNALKKPFNFEKDEFYELDAEKLDFVKTKDELQKRWQTSLKYETLARIYDKKKEQEKAAEKSDTVTVMNMEELEAYAREKILKRYDDWFHRLSKTNDNDRLNLYVNSLVNVFDPHTMYFPPKDKENFDIRFSGQLEGIGAQLTQRNEYIEVNRIIPGSPSWKQGILEVGDYILKVAQGDEDFVDVVDMRLDEAVLLIRGKKGTTVRLSIKKIDGTIETISLVRDVVVLEETYAKSVIIQSEEDKNFGYIKLPSFYVDFAKINGKNCYDDMKEEVRKLMAENTEGIIFDLRDNGGGSLEDVVKIAGLFIEEGPIVQSKGRKNSKKIFRDTDSNIQFDGPLVVMVNPISASASEIFAAALQDYKRAVVIGGNSTYGKGTVQNFTELDRMVPKKPMDMTELGSLKMTVQKFYRVNGGATQLKGVVPDIILPDYYNYMDFGERDLDNTMPWDEISAVEWDVWNTSYDMDYIIEISKKRIAHDTLFGLIDENSKRLKKLRDDTKYSLQYEKFVTRLEDRKTEGEKYDSIGKHKFDINLELLQADAVAMETDTSKKARSDAWMDELKKDIYLVEAINILKDIENYQVKNARKEK